MYPFNEDQGQYFGGSDPESIREELARSQRADEDIARARAEDAAEEADAEHDAAKFELLQTAEILGNIAPEEQPSDVFLSIAEFESSLDRLKECRRAWEHYREEVNRGIARLPVAFQYMDKYSGYVEKPGTGPHFYQKERIDVRALVRRAVKIAKGDLPL